ncbi:MAG: cyclic nucleotide-binding domain-containing protein [SAR324 cluster bacterium]|nr:cyclic nucleotide-binding domain-containing protein [SAR324 cluster bacterium]
MPKIEKIEISAGLYWITIEDAKLKILCGCPEDSVKHMMKRGLTMTKEEAGVAFETGPNAILLSDISIQNGKFANLAEFPVLQMLYRQGMILPNHPNNNGSKPILIGTAEQVDTQMEYIYRGNYGLVSEEEIIETGTSPEQAHEMMRLKLKFAFGAIRNSDELLDKRVVGSTPVEIQNGVSIHRLQMNVYEFHYENEAVQVNLNLPPNTTYSPTYRLHFHNIEREYFGIIHSGEGNGWDIHRPCMSSILMFQGKIYLIDAGPNLLNNLTVLGISVNEVEGIFHTHGHDDHFAGMTTLVQADHRIKYYTTALVRHSVFKKLSALMSVDEKQLYDYFEIHDLASDTWNDLAGLEVYPMFSPHPVENSIFIFRSFGEKGYRSYAHFADIVGMDTLKGMIEDDPAKPGITPAFFDDVQSQYLQRVDIKKIDAGGGLIHGEAEDFREDESQQIMLSHTEMDLTESQKMIGSGAPFGMVDVLIPGEKNYYRQYAFTYLQSYFPDVPRHRLEMLLNNPIVTFNPERILIRSGEEHQEIYLMLTGSVEQIQTQLKMYNILSAGSLIGEMSGLIGMPSIETYRALNFVQAMKLPVSMYIEFVKKAGVYEEIEELQSRREFLQASHIFGGGLSYLAQNRIANVMEEISYSPGDIISGQFHSAILLVIKGSIELHTDEKHIETLTTGGCIGEEEVLFNTPSHFHIKATEDTDVYQIPGNLLLDIPIVRWRLLEIFEKRLQAAT